MRKFSKIALVLLMLVVSAFGLVACNDEISGISVKQEDMPWKYRNHALFVGYAPHVNPKYAVAVLVEHGGGGSAVAAPIGSKLLQEALKLDEEKK